MESTTCEQNQPKPLILNDRDFLFLVHQVFCESASLTQPTLRPALDNHLLFCIELDGVATLRVQIAEETRLPSAEGEISDWCRNAYVDADVACGSCVLETTGGSSVGGKQ